MLAIPRGRATAARCDSAIRSDCGRGARRVRPAV